VVTENLRDAKRWLEPAAIEVRAAALVPLIELHGTPAGWDQMTPIYLDALADMPPDLLVEAVRRVIRNVKFFPKPAEIRTAIAEELALRKLAVMRLELAARLAKPEPGASIGADRRPIAALVAMSTRRMETEPEDLA
jgi:hypothetical protein